MENKQLKRLPIGIQSFEKIREADFLYIDKTKEVYDLANNMSQYVFLSRPRRFGKSLLTSTLHSYFDGRKDLFEGLAICELEKEWEKFPVLHFDMSLGKHSLSGILECNSKNMRSYMVLPPLRPTTISALHS